LNFLGDLEQIPTWRNWIKGHKEFYLRLNLRNVLALANLRSFYWRLKNHWSEEEHWSEERGLLVIRSFLSQGLGY
jgi:hypothetical protein